MTLHRHAFHLCFTFSCHDFTTLLGTDDHEYSEAIFKALDSRGNGQVDAYETLSIVVMLANVSGQDKIQLLAELHDTSGHELLRKEDLVILIRTVLTGLVKVDASVESVATCAIESLVDTMFQSFDKDLDDDLTKAELMTFLLNDQREPVFNAKAFLDYWSYSVRQHEIKGDVASSWKDPDLYELKNNPSFVYLDPSRGILPFDMIQVGLYCFEENCFEYL